MGFKKTKKKKKNKKKKKKQLKLERVDEATSEDTADTSTSMENNPSDGDGEKGHEESKGKGEGEGEGKSAGKRPAVGSSSYDVKHGEISEAAIDEAINAIIARFTPSSLPTPSIPRESEAITTEVPEVSEETKALLTNLFRNFGISVEFTTLRSDIHPELPPMTVLKKVEQQPSSSSAAVLETSNRNLLYIKKLLSDDRLKIPETSLNGPLYLSKQSGRHPIEFISLKDKDSKTWNFTSRFDQLTGCYTLFLKEFSQKHNLEAGDIILLFGEIYNRKWSIRFVTAKELAAVGGSLDFLILGN